MGPRLLGQPLNVVAGLLVLGSGLWLTVLAAHGRPIVEAAIIGAAGAVATGLVSTLAWTLVWMPRSRRAFEAFTWLGERELERFVAVTGRHYPATFDGMKRYVEREPERPADLWIRAEILAASGDLDGSARTAQRMPGTTPAERLEREVALVYVDWLGGGSGEPAAVRTALAAIDPTDVDARRDGEIALAISEVRHRVAREDADPAQPLRAARDRLGRDADGILFAAARRIGPVYVRAAALYIAIAIVVDRLING
jgi:hypothetical protein